MMVEVTYCGGELFGHLVPMYKRLEKVLRLL